MKLVGQTENWRQHPATIVLLLSVAVVLWFWNVRALFQQHSGETVQTMETPTLPEVPDINQAFIELPALERDPFMAPAPKKPDPPKQKAQREAVVPQKPMPPNPPQGTLQMVLKRQDGFAAIFKFGKKEPEVLVVGDTYMQWQVMDITLNQVTWHHQPSESDYVSRIP